MHILEATIHSLQKKAHTNGEGSVTKQLRTTPLPIDDTLETVCRDLLSLYNRTTDSSGMFGSNTTVHLFPVRLSEYLNQSIDLATFSEATIDLIAARMESARLSNGGYVLFLRYSEPPNDFMLIAMLKLRPGAGIDETSLELLPTLNIDLSLLNEAARINITRLKNNEQPYLTFIKGARKATEVTEYFRDALACLNYTNSSEQTKELIRAADDFVAKRTDLTEEMRQHEKVQTRSRLYDCLNQNSTELTLTTAAAAIYPDAPEEFITHAQTQQNGERVYKFDTRFRPDRKVSQSLRRIRGTMGTVTIAFDVQDVQTGRVMYDPQNDAIIIRQPNPKLKQDIQEYVDGTA